VTKQKIFAAVRKDAYAEVAPPKLVEAAGRRA
jgi:hypothetical protein